MKRVALPVALFVVCLILLVYTSLNSAHAASTVCSVLQEPPPLAAQNATLVQAAKGTAADDLWAVGYQRSTTSSSAQTLVVHRLNGTTSVQPSPNRAGNSFLSGISVISSNDVWAVGHAYTSTSASTVVPLVAHYDGATWQEVLIPSGANIPADAELNAVVAQSTNGHPDVWMMGSYGVSTYPHGLGLHYDGASWALFSNFTPPGSVFRAAAGVASNDIWAGGYYSNTLALFMHWDGGSWTQPASAWQNAYINDMSMSGTNLWASGHFQNSAASYFYNRVNQNWVIDQHTDLEDVTGIDATGALVWISGNQPDGHAALKFYDSSWHYFPVADNIQLNDVVVLNNGITWAVGEQLNYPTPGQSRMALYQVCNEDLTPTPTVTGTPPTATSVPSTTPVPPATATPGTCTISFTDVHTSDYFYEPVRYLACRGSVSGYADGTFRPYSYMTRAQVAKIVVLAKHWTFIQEPQRFSDVPPSNPFYAYIQTAAAAGAISGYADGTFKPYNEVTRAQLAKIIVLAQQWQNYTIGGPHFSDVPFGSTFYNVVETAYHYGVISGYADGTFRPNTNVTRGQVSKIIYLAITEPVPPTNTMVPPAKAIVTPHK